MVIKRVKSWVLLAGMVMMLPLNAFSQESTTQCANENPAIIATTPTADFELNTDGTAVHKPTQLMWMRCGLGQTWDSSTGECAGSMTGYTWAGALQQAESSTFAGYSDWRLPNRNELLSIFERRCWNPSANIVVFPNIPNAQFWTSSPLVADRLNAWHVNFFSGTANCFGYCKKELHKVRLVRTAAP